MAKDMVFGETCGHVYFVPFKTIVSRWGTTETFASHQYKRHHRKHDFRHYASSTFVGTILTILAVMADIVLAFYVIFVIFNHFFAILRNFDFRIFPIVCDFMSIF